MKNRIFSTILFTLSLILTIGIKTFFSGCGPKEDGSWMLCHWTEQTIFILGICLSIISLIALIFDGKKNSHWYIALSNTCGYHNSDHTRNSDASLQNANNAVPYFDASCNNDHIFNNNSRRHHKYNIHIQIDKER